MIFFTFIFNSGMQSFLLDPEIHHSSMRNFNRYLDSALTEYSVSIHHQSK